LFDSDIKQGISRNKSQVVV